MSTRENIREKKATSRIKVLRRLWPMRWVSWSELKEVAARYSARVGELRDAGWQIEDRPTDGDDAQEGKDYRLTIQKIREPRTLLVRLDLEPSDVQLLLSGGVIYPALKGKIERALERQAESQSKLRRSRQADIEYLVSRGLSPED